MYVWGRPLTRMTEGERPCVEVGPGVIGTAPRGAEQGGPFFSAQNCSPLWFGGCREPGGTRRWTFLHPEVSHRDGSLRAHPATPSHGARLPRDTPRPSLAPETTCSQQDAGLPGDFKYVFKNLIFSLTPTKMESDLIIFKTSFTAASGFVRIETQNALCIKEGFQKGSHWHVTRNVYFIHVKLRVYLKEELAFMSGWLPAPSPRVLSGRAQPARRFLVDTVLFLERII